MHIKLTQDVSTSYVKTAKGGYSKAEINYEGAKFPFKLMSFSNPAVFEALKNAKAGQEFEVDSVKEGDFYQWKAVKEVTGETKPAEKATTYTPGKSTYETPEERAVKQRLIVRQSSLSNAIEFLGGSAAKGTTEEELFNLAERMSAWVYETPDLFDFPNDLTEA